MIKLVDYKQEYISRGNIFRFPAQYPYEAHVDLMVIEKRDCESGYALMVTTGYKAGLTLLILPTESLLSDGSMLSTKWIISNWNKWIYAECKVNEVYIQEKYLPHIIH